MGLRIKTNGSALTAQRFLAKTSQDTAGNIERLSSGFRINKAADDAAGLSITNNLTAEIRSMEQAKRNANDGVSLIQVAEGSMNEVSNILIRMRELATQAASDTIGNNERAFTNREYTELVNEIDRIVNTTEFNGINLLGGADKNDGIEELTLHIGAGDGSIENTDTIEMNINDIRLNAQEVLGLNNEAEIGPLEAGDEFSREVAAEKLNVIDDAINRVAGNRATLGAMQSRLDSAITNLSIQVENMANSRSRIRDVDYATETADFSQNRILAQAGSSVLAQASSLPEMALGLLR